MSIRNYNAWVKAARRAAKRTAGLSLPYKRKALARAQARVTKAQARVGKAESKLTKANLSLAKVKMAAARRDMRAVERAGAVTMKQARAAYQKMKARLGRAPKGTDVKKHPGIFRDTGLGRPAKRRAAKVREPVSKEPPTGPSLAPPKKRVIRSIQDFVALGAVDFGSLTGKVEYVSTAEYEREVTMLQVQVHIKLPKPGPGVEYSRALLDEIAERWLKREKLPKNIQVTAISWNGSEPVTGGAMEDARFRFGFIAENGPFEFTGRIAPVG